MLKGCPHIRSEVLCTLASLKTRILGTYISKSNKLVCGFQLHSNVLHVMRSRDLVCQSFRISSQFEAFFRVSHNMIQHTEMLMVTMITGKVKLSLPTPRRHVRRRGVEVHLHSFLTSALNAGEWSTSRSGRVIPWKEQRYQLNRRLRGPQRRSRLLEIRKISCPFRDPNPGFSGPQFNHYTDCASPANLIIVSMSMTFSIIIIIIIIIIIQITTVRHIWEYSDLSSSINVYCSSNIHSGMSWNTNSRNEILSFSRPWPWTLVLVDGL
jgi:hypothetical protein